jgi:hypothetical protein
MAGRGHLALPRKGRFLYMAVQSEGWSQEALASKAFWEVLHLKIFR